MINLCSAIPHKVTIACYVASSSCLSCVIAFFVWWNLTHVCFGKSLHHLLFNCNCICFWGQVWFYDLMILLGPCNFTFVNFKQRPTTPTLSHATPTHALHVKGCFSLIAKFMLYMCQRPLIRLGLSHYFWPDRPTGTLRVDLRSFGNFGYRQWLLPSFLLETILLTGMD